MSYKSDIRLYLIVPVYGNWNDTLDCLRMLGAQSDRDFRVIVADDGSPEPPPSSLGDFPFVEYLRNPHRGFAANCNAGARVACSRGASHLLFLNNDTAFSSDFTQGWRRRIGEMPDAILSPMVYWFHKPDRVWYSGGRQSIWVPFVRLKREYREVTPVDILSGCVILVPSNHWRELGGFNEKFVTYYEDFDFALRAKKRGVRAYVTAEPELRVLHKGSRSAAAAGVWPMQYRMLTSRFVFIREHYSGLRKYACLGLGFAHLAATMLMTLPQTPKPRLLWRSIADGLRIE